MKFKTLIALLFSTLLLVSCGGSDSGDEDSGNNEPSTATLTGTAAEGAALASKTVTVVDRLGIEVTTTTAADGSFSIVVNGDANPYMLKVEGNSAGEVFYSYADGAGVVNVTPMTSLALHEAFKDGASYSDLADKFSSFSSDYNELTPAELEAAKAKVNANLGSSLFSTNGVDNGFDFFETAFSADGSGIDAILDAIDITIGSGTDAGNIMISFNGASFISFNSEIDISEFTIGGSNGSTGGLSGTWDLTITGTSGGFQIPAVVINDYPANAVPTSESAGEAEQAFNQSFGAVGSVSNYNYQITSSSDTRVVLNVSATVTLPAQVIGGFSVPGVVTSYDLTYTYTKN